MGRVCREVQEWIEEEIEQPIEEWENRQEERCREEPCNWWMLCLNKLFCWLVWVTVKVIRWVVVTVGKWVTRIVCEIVNVILDVVGFIVNLILSIPVIGGIIRTILNWVTEIIWRLAGLIDFLVSWAGLRLRKKMYFGVVVPSVRGTPIATDADIMNQVNAAIAFFDQTCNINMIFTGICHTGVKPPDAGLTVGCDAGGFFNDWWLAGSYFEFAAATCKFTDGFRRVIGYGAEIIVFIVQNVTPDTPSSTTRGCSFGSTHNYVVVEAGTAVSNFMASHEIGHACWLPHDGGTNLMNPSVPFTNPTLTALQIATVRGSKHCVYL
ncbi:zinc-dependent metalloprotease [Fulvivirga ulvae]|uniref:zinc-dependent metalloprotease n=1 Tax=Fulvivirga ulvae TaxID=2904245 RepID=UPI001F17F427|nr:zinc-dependent metalloprotease [Fulvivirga ulvae]UII29747.1 zinc-dependent metalloprotease [Fulvivirga ulvae]